MRILGKKKPPPAPGAVATSKLRKLVGKTKSPASTRGREKNPLTEVAAPGTNSVKLKK